MKPGTPRPQEIFDASKLEVMNEPLTVRVEKLRNGVRQTIPMPEGAPDDAGVPQAPGVGWTKAGVLGIEQWLLTQWSGGGFYRITVTDSTEPAPMSMTWTTNYPPTEYPEKVPPTLTSAASHAANHQQRPPSMNMNTPAFPGGLPLSASYPPAPTYPQFPQAFPQPYQAPPPSYQAQPNYQIEMERRETAATLERMRVELARAQEAAVTARHEQALKQEHAATEARFSKLEGLIMQLVSGNSSAKANPEIEMLKEQNRALAEKAEADRRERDAERREAALRESMRVQHETTLRQIETMQTQFQTMMAAAANKGPDPMIALMQEQARMQLEAMKDLSRSQTSSIDRLMPLVMTPAAMMEMQRNSAAATENVTSQITRSMSGVLDVQRIAMENLVQMNPQGGKGVADIVEGAIDRASGLAEKWVGAKSAEARAQMQAQASAVQANAHVQAANAQAMAEQARTQRAAMQAPVVVAGPPVDAKLAEPKAVSPVAAAPIAAGLNGIAVNGNGLNGAKLSFGRTDEQWFGPLLENVQELRKGVARCIESVTMVPIRLDPKTGLVDGIEPAACASAIMQAVNFVLVQNIPIPAMKEILGEFRYDDFMSVLLPDAPYNYRLDVMKILIPMMEAGDKPEGDSEVEQAEGDEDPENGEDDDDVRNARPAAQA